MAEEKRNAEQLGGEYMIQDRDHMSQMGGQTGTGRQSDQSQGDSRQQGGGQQGGEQRRKTSEQSQKRGKLL